MQNPLLSDLDYLSSNGQFATTILPTDLLVIGREYPSPGGAARSGFEGTNFVPLASSYANLVTNLSTVFAPVSTYEVHAALITQSSTSSPSSINLGISTIPGTITWARTGTGVYTATSSGTPFTVGKTAIFIGSQALSEGVTIDVTMTSTSVITVTTKLLSYSSGLVYTATDGLLTNIPMEVRIYH